LSDKYTDLIDLDLEVKAKYVKSSKRQNSCRKVSKEYKRRGGKADWMPGMSNYTFTVFRAISGLMEKMPIKVLYESAHPSNELKRVAEQYLKANSDPSEIGRLFGEKRELIESSVLAGKVKVIEIGRKRDELCRNMIDKLLADFPELNLFIIFGSKHAAMIEPYLIRPDLEVKQKIIDDESELGKRLNSCFRSGVYDEVTKGQVLVKEALRVFFYLTLGIELKTVSLWDKILGHYKQETYLRYVNSLQEAKSMVEFLLLTRDFINEANLFAPLFLPTPEIYHEFQRVVKEDPLSINKDLFDAFTKAYHKDDKR
jgi:hypothetical protein